MQPSGTENTIPQDNHSALFDLINEFRALQGWSGLKAEEADPMIQTWWRQLERHKIPASAYRQLLQSAVDLRAKKIERGQEPPSLTVELLISCWPHLRDEIRERMVRERRTLPVTCDKCDEYGWEEVFVGGESMGMRRCSHG